LVPLLALLFFMVALPPRSGYSTKLASLPVATERRSDAVFRDRRRARDGGCRRSAQPPAIGPM